MANTTSKAKLNPPLTEEEKARLYPFGLTEEKIARDPMLRFFGIFKDDPDFMPMMRRVFREPWKGVATMSSGADNLYVFDTDLLSSCLRHNPKALAFLATTRIEDRRATIVNEIDLLRAGFSNSKLPTRWNGS